MTEKRDHLHRVTSAQCAEKRCAKFEQEHRLCVCIRSSSSPGVGISGFFFRGTATILALGILVAVLTPAKSFSLFWGLVENTFISTKNFKSKDPTQQEWGPTKRNVQSRRLLRLLCASCPKTFFGSFALKSALGGFPASPASSGLSCCHELSLFLADTRGVLLFQALLELAR